MENPVDYNRISSLVSESSDRMKQLLQEAYRTGFLEGADYQRRELTDMLRATVAEYSQQVEKHQQGLNSLLGKAAQGQAPSGPSEIRPVATASPAAGKAVNE